ncbi:unnamed protein product [Lactuca saligna]|uniref:Glycosyl hydrolase family 38 C-terminal domain-containing protein n=1 Tax=Lactuca saligna TaxID=75948 RepID=A0AA35V6K6_LACSI|nr:unnamed protein product [Lactuca saligna]
MEHSYNYYSGYNGTDQASRAYIFRPNATFPIKSQGQIGPIPIDDGVGKEITTLITSALKTNKTFYTDSNRKDFIKRVRDFRTDWELQVNEPVAGNYYPINLMLIMKIHVGIELIVDKGEFPEHQCANVIVANEWIYLPSETNVECLKSDLVDYVLKHGNKKDNICHSCFKIKDCLIIIDHTFSKIKLLVLHILSKWGTDCELLSTLLEAALLMVSMDDMRVIGQHGSFLWCPWMTYGSLVKMIVAYCVMVSPIDYIWVIGQHVAYGVMVSPMDDIRVIGQHGSCLWYPWMTYESLVNMVVAYGVMVSPMDDIWVIG